MLIPIIGGSKVNSETSHTVSLWPVNTYFKDSKMRSIPGIRQFALLPGMDRGGHFYRSEIFSGHFRVAGDKLVKVGIDGKITLINADISIPGSEKVIFSSSIFNLAFVAGGNYYLYNPADGLRHIDKTTSDKPLGKMLDITWQQQSFLLLHYKEDTKSFLIEQTNPGKDSEISGIRNTVDDSDPDKPVSIETEHSYFILFNKHSITFWTFQEQDSDKFSYRPILSKQIDGGLVGRDAKALLGSTWIILSINVPNKEPNFYQVGSTLEAIAPIDIQNVLKRYTETELETTRLEAYQVDGIDMLIVHLPKDSLMFNAQTGLWITLKSKNDQFAPISYRAINPVRDQELNVYIVGDLLQPILGRIDEQLGTEYDKSISQVMFTPYLLINQRLRHLVIEGNYANWPDDKQPQLIIQATDAGLGYGQPLALRLPKGRDYLRKISQKGLGLLRGNIGFRIEINTRYSVELDAQLYCNEDADKRIKVM